MAPPLTVLAAYPDSIRGAEWTPVSGGLSGAVVWSGSVNGSIRYALKGWPPGITAERVEAIHTYQLAVAGLPYVPDIERTIHGSTLIRVIDRCWEISGWMPGVPARDGTLTPDRIAATVVALRDIHARWSQIESAIACCPAVLRRLNVIEEYRHFSVRGQSVQIASLLQIPFSRLHDALEAAISRLTPWSHQRVRVQPCFTDIHREHVLFTGETVTGVIDYGAVKPDSPAADIARLFGDDSRSLSQAVEVYGGLPGGLCEALAESAAAVNLAAWTLRLLRDGETPADPAAVRSRISRWVDRLP